MPKKVLIIDDELEMLSLIQQALEKSGFQTETCDDGRQAWDALQRFQPDLVILDVMLPGIDGYSLQIKMSQAVSTSRIPTIILTGLEPSRTLFSKFPQVVGFVSKPFRTDELVGRVQKALATPAPLSHA